MSRSPEEIPVIVMAFSEITKKETASSRGMDVSFLAALPFPLPAGMLKEGDACHF